MALLSNLEAAVTAVSSLASQGDGAASGEKSQPAGSPTTSAFVLTDAIAKRLLRAVEDALFYGLKVPAAELPSVLPRRR